MSNFVFENYLIFIDESWDPAADKFCLGALMVPESHCDELEARLSDFRMRLEMDFEIPADFELKGRWLCAKKGRKIDNVLFKRKSRHQIFRDALELIATADGVQLFNSVSTYRQRNLAYDYLFNRINKNLGAKFGEGRIIHDSGQETFVDPLTTKLKNENLIPSKFMTWASGNIWKDVSLSDVLGREVEHRDSSTCRLLQAADWQAHALLRYIRGEKVIKNQVVRTGIDRAFEILEPRIVRAASPKTYMHIVFCGSLYYEGRRKK